MKEDARMRAEEDRARYEENERLRQEMQARRYQESLQQNYSVPYYRDPNIVQREGVRFSPHRPHIPKRPTPPAIYVPGQQ